MSHLIISLIAIAFMGSALWVGTNKINYDIYDQRLTEAQITSDLKTYSSAIETYKKTINIYPSNTNWEADLMNLKLMIPKNNGEYRYSYTPNPSNPDLDFIGLCYIDSVEKKDYQNIKEIHEKGVTVLSDSCFDLNSKTLDESGTTVDFALTSWVKADWKYINTGLTSPVTPIVPSALSSGRSRLNK